MLGYLYGNIDAELDNEKQREGLSFVISSDDQNFSA